MKIIKIGRSSSNDVKINDSLVSRVHCQITQDDCGNFHLIDINSKNGTFINGVKIQGEVHLNKYDVVRIGNTTLPWQSYFHTSTKTNVHKTECKSCNKNILTIGRRNDNDIVINDIYVSSSHCQIIKNANNTYTIIDNNSKNGTYINGTRIYGAVQLSTTDKVRIGGTELPWLSYFTTFGSTEYIPEGPEYISEEPEYIPNPEKPIYIPPAEPVSAKQESSLGVVSLIVSIVAVGLFIYAFINIQKWGILALMGNSFTYLICSFGLNIIAIILASICNYKEEDSNSSANSAEFLSGLCMVLEVGLYLYLRFGDPSIFNPLG